MTNVQDAIDISGGPGKGEWKIRAEMALRMLDRELEEYRKAVDGGSDLESELHLAMAGDWAAIYSASMAAAGN